MACAGHHDNPAIGSVAFSAAQQSSEVAAQWRVEVRQQSLDSVAAATHGTSISSKKIQRYAIAAGGAAVKAFAQQMRK